MNTTVLTKCLQELTKDKPNIDKVIGMIETMIEMGGSNQTRDLPVANSQSSNITNVPYITNSNSDFATDSSGLIESIYGKEPGKIGGLQ